MRLVLAFMALLPVFGQTAIFKPLPLSATAPALGKGKQAGIWTVSVCAPSGYSTTIHRARLMMAAPQIHEIPNRQAEDLLTRRAAGDSRSKWSAIGDVATGLAASGLTTSGIITGTKGATWAGLGLSVLQATLTLVRKQAPNPAVYVSDLLPESINLAPNACGTWLVVAGLTRGVETIGPVNLEEK